MCSMRSLDRFLIAWVLVALQYIPCQAEHYFLIAVSGGLQDGFPDHTKLDYRDPSGWTSPAVFLGQALVRGTKAYLDVMEKDWRQYNPEPGLPLINSVNLVSGCWEHANQYWVYAVDTRQVLSVLNNEPRFLSITPDTALVDLTSNETDATIRLLAHHELDYTLGKSDRNAVALSIVVATWYHKSFVPSPVVRMHEDGTMVTNFQESLAKWAQVDDGERTASSCQKNKKKQDCLSASEVVAAQRRYWMGIKAAVRHAEKKALPQEIWKDNGPPFDCQRQAPLGVGPEQGRINYSFSGPDLFEIYRKNGFFIDFDKGTLTPSSSKEQS